MRFSAIDSSGAPFRCPVGTDALLVVEFFSRRGTAASGKRNRSQDPECYAGNKIGDDPRCYDRDMRTSYRDPKANAPVEMRHATNGCRPGDGAFAWVAALRPLIFTLKSLPLSFLALASVWSKQPTSL